MSRNPARPGLLLAGALPLLLCGGAGAEPIADLRNALGHLDGRTPIRGTAEIRSRGSDDETGESRSGVVSVDVEDSGSGLRVLYPRELLDRIGSEGTGPPADGEMPASEVLQDAGPVALGDALGFARPLRRRLDGGSLLAQHPAADGEPARLVIQAIAARPEETLYDTEGELVVTLWLGDDGLPTAVETAETSRAGKLFIKVTTELLVRRELARIGDRLVVTRSRSRMSVSGLGRSFTREVETLLQLDPPGPEADEPAPVEAPP